LGGNNVDSDMRLKGMTWDHPRGYDPLLACSRIWRDEGGVEIVWDRRSLQDFEAFPVEELARRYDLIVLDHPHIGQVVAEGCLAPLDVAGGEAHCRELARGSVGPSFESYRWNGRQWALPIDAATQVQAWRADLVAAPAERWEDVMRLARQGVVHCPLRPPHSLMVLYTLAANLGRPCGGDPHEFLDAETGARVYEMLRELTSLIDAVCYGMDPIAVSEAMARPDARVVCVPLIYGYVSYAREQPGRKRISFANIPAAGSNGPVGSVLGGTGIAVSARTELLDAAIDFAYWVASAEVQRGPYASAGGQPGHAAAWEDRKINTDAGDFFTATRATLNGAWLRPRHSGSVPFQQAASVRLNEALMGGERPQAFIADLNAMHRESLG
jgi:multiple sugar transport system substrate-binding protein